MRIFILGVVLITSNLAFSCEHLYPKKDCLKDNNVTLQQLEACALKGDIVSQRYLADAYATGMKGLPKDPEKEFFWGLKAAEAGCAEEQRMIGYAYYYGSGVAPSVELAAKWWRLAAQQKDAEAICALGYITYTGEIEEDNHLEVAFRRIKQGTDLGAKNCVVHLAKLYYYGEGTEQNIELAKSLIDQAVKDRVPYAKEARDEIYEISQ